MVSRDFEIKKHIVTEKVLTKEILICDICNNEISPKQYYWRLHTYHDDWGNDSVDSHEYFDACSRKCTDIKYEEYMKGSKMIPNTMCLEIERRYNSCKGVIENE